MGIDPIENTDNASILLKYENGTNAVINYFAIDKFDIIYGVHRSLLIIIMLILLYNYIINV